ncbi:hypothetical protein Tco_0077260 [Tanacetum coccineum]
MAAFAAACYLCGSLRSSLQPMWQPPQQPEPLWQPLQQPATYVAAFPSKQSEAFIEAFLAMLQPLQQPATLVAAFTAACTLCGSLRKSQQALFHPLQQHATFPATYVAAFAAACNLSGSIRNSQQSLLQPLQQPATYVVAFVAGYNLRYSLEHLPQELQLGSHNKYESPSRILQSIASVNVIRKCLLDTITEPDLY